MSVPNGWFVRDAHGVADAITVVYLPEGPTAYFKLTSIELSKKIHVGPLANNST